MCSLWLSGGIGSECGQYDYDANSVAVLSIYAVKSYTLDHAVDNRLINDPIIEVFLGLILGFLID